MRLTAPALMLALVACETVVPPAPTHSPPAETPVASVASQPCPLPREPEYLPWGASGGRSVSAGPVSAIRYENGPSSFRLERRHDTAGAPTFVSVPPTLIYGRETRLMWSGAPGASALGAWWREGTGECTVYHALLTYSGAPTAAEVQFAKVIGSIPAAFVDPAAGVTGLVAEISLDIVPSYLTVMPAERRLYVTDRQPALRVYDTTTNALLKRALLPLTDGRIPASLAVLASTKRVYVPDKAGDRVLVFDAMTLDPVTTIRVGPGPGAIAADQETGRIYVAESGYGGPRSAGDLPGSVSVIDGRTNAVVAKVQTPGRPITVAAAGPRLYVGALALLPSESSFIQVVDARAYREVARVDVSPPHLLLADTVDGVVYALSNERRSTPSGSQVVSSKWIELDMRTNGAAILASGPGDARAIAWDDGGDPRYPRVYVATQRDVGGALTFYSAPSAGSTRLVRLSAELRVGADPGAIAVDSSTLRVYVTSTTQRKISVIVQAPR